MNEQKGGHENIPPVFNTMAYRYFHVGYFADIRMLLLIRQIHSHSWWPTVTLHSVINRFTSVNWYSSYCILFKWKLLIWLTCTVYVVERFSVWGIGFESVLVVMEWPVQCTDCNALFGYSNPTGALILIKRRHFRLSSVLYICCL